MTKIKICGLSRPEDIHAVNEAMPDYAGFVFAKSSRQATYDQAFKLRDLLSPHIKTVGVFQNAKLEQIKEALEMDISDIIQLHGNEDECYIQKLKDITPRPIIKAISVTCSEDIERWQNSAANYLLLDNRQAGSGKSFDWELVGNYPKLFFLAGGINYDNVMQAIEKTNPYAVDISSGVETNGKKDREKIIFIIRRIRNE
jgi:phosphoribosylanthranilate isomerase